MPLMYYFLLAVYTTYLLLI